jgi:hypothetical protein
MAVDEDADELYNSANRRRSRLDESAGGPLLDADEAPAPAEQLERVRLKRSRLEAWVEEPFFESVATGCFVRVGVGTDLSGSGEQIYRIAEVVGVSLGSTAYKLGEKTTKKRLLLEIAGSRKVFAMTFVSNSNFTPDELRKYRKQLEEKMLPRKTQRELDDKVAALLKAKSYVYNEKVSGQPRPCPTLAPSYLTLDHPYPDSDPNE